MDSSAAMRMESLGTWRFLADQQEIDKEVFDCNASVNDSIQQIDLLVIFEVSLLQLILYKLQIIL